MASHTSHWTPLKHISQGSLFTLSRSGHNSNAPHGLGFLEPVMSELVDEAEALEANVDGLRKLSQSFGIFNEGFSSFLYVMDMNALTTDWPQAPTDASFRLARRRAEIARVTAEAAPKAAEAILPMPPPDPDTDRTTYTENADCEMTFMTAAIVTSTSTTTAMTKPPTKARKKAKPKLTAKEKKERLMTIEKLIYCLPLEFRGSDPVRRSIIAVEWISISSLESAP
ncbi:hypothetical protein PISMIDRAFT_688595 [Pisolithus microcarpus 441]|uniref:DASH complex subunit DAM1 n=1 Tax=Pisolithus microcarpus 441 TaxID=765257 RepID=A0A0C9YTE1_9AGAM|nr:hypothetical protein PISMIDRAFT_688595 [Pisolithus microcarpus 441]